MFIDVNLFILFWPYVVKTVAYIINFIIIESIIKDKQIISYKIQFNKVFFINHLRIWGLKVIIYISKKKRKSKLYLRGEYDIFIGYINIFNQYLIYLIKKRKVRVYNASIIIFNEFIIRSIIADLSVDLSSDDLTLVGESNDQFINTNNSSSTSSIERELSSLVKANNIKDINIDIK